jgi:hypothetical protein
MKSRPLMITLFSILLISIGFSVPVQAMFLQNYENFFRSLTVLNVVMASLCILSAVAVYHVHKSFRYLLPLTLATVIFNNWWVGYVGFDFSMNETTLASFAFAGVFCSLLEKKTFQVLRNPKLKWWHVAARKKLSIPVSLKKLRGNTLVKKAFDISESGVFLQGLEQDEFQNYRVGERIELDLHFNEILKIRCQARVVRKSESQGVYPAGIGLQFAENDVRTRSTIKRLVNDAEAAA